MKFAKSLLIGTGSVVLATGLRSSHYLYPRPHTQ